MAYDKKTGTVTISSNDPKELERDFFRHMEEVTRQLAQDPNCPPETVAEYEQIKKANKAFDNYDKLKALTDQAQAIKQVHNSQINSSSGSTRDKTGETMKRTAISLNLLQLLIFGYMVATKSPPRGEEIFLVIVWFAAPVTSLVALTLAGGESWLGLYFRRKTLEEKQRIKNLGG